MSYKIILETEWPIAIDSPDHLEPEGVMNDNVTSLAFIDEVERQFKGKQLHVLDLGCAGGALIHDFLRRGHIAIGLEGSDFNLVTRRAEWAALGNKNLFTCDVTREFSLSCERNGECQPFLCDIITSWEVMEHLPRERLPVFFENIRRHLKLNGHYVAGVCLGSGTHHQSVFPLEVWEHQILSRLPGLQLRPYPYQANGHPSASSYYFMLQRSC